MFSCFGGDRYWPVTSTVMLVKLPFDQFLEETGTTVETPRRRWPFSQPADESAWKPYANLDEAITQGAPHPNRSSARGHFIVETANGWTAVLPVGSWIETYRYEPSHLKVDVDAVYVSFRPRSTDLGPHATFEDFRCEPIELPPNVRQTNTLTVDVFADADHWSWYHIGPDRPYEEPAYYAERIKADRLPFDLLKRYAAAVGVPVDGPDILTGRVLVAPPLTRTSSPMPTWSSLPELRANHGYPPTGVITTLTTRPPRSKPRAANSRTADRPAAVDGYRLPRLSRLTPDEALPVWIAGVPPARRWATLLELRENLAGWTPVLLAGDREGVGRDCAALDEDYEPAPVTADDELESLAEAGLGRVDPARLERSDITNAPWPEKAALDGTLCLVPTPDAADVLGLLKWDGPANVMTMPQLTALLRRWNRLVGATLVRADPEGSSLQLIIARPPVDLTVLITELEFCCDTCEVLPGPAGTAPLIRLWWD